MKRRTLITGYGTTSALDHLPHEGDFYDRLSSTEAYSAVAPSKVRPVEDQTFLPLVDDRQFRRADRFSKMALAASQKTLTSAGLTISPLNQERTGMVFNTCFGPLRTTETYMQKVVENGAKLAPPALFPYTVLNAFTGLIAMSTKAVGSNSTICGASAFCYGLDLIRQNKDDAMLVGGCEELTPSLIGRFGGSGKAEQSSSPNREMVLGEGAAMLLIESYDVAKERRGTPLAEVLDYGSTNAINHSQGPYSMGSGVIERAMWEALERSQVTPSEIGLFAAGANGAPGLREAEQEALLRVFGKEKPPAKIESKKVLGETFGASESFALISVACLLARENRGSSEYARNSCPPLAMVNCYEFGGNVHSIVLRSPTV